MTKKIVSACLAGFQCRFDCAHKEREEIRAMVEKGEAIAVCPEQMGGLPTPRTPAEQIGNKIISKTGTDVTAEYELGAHQALKMAELTGATEAYLKSRSPMCGSGQIYDGSFSGKLVEGDGVFTKLLKSRNIKVIAVD
ncbi:DUF523 domain-containing protein [Peredibacter starrii]|uniref:DUF523 domain-containing protein n=1 Tax=Peredibacter starrii TaxID=28202 RepID=A0AAX4HUT6_9BACT|nr:DUF523 domain-containing protein [Peredibacter starrii]WPU67146.1 DUF523 domain-containing protein [Peredibacter starrii]